MGSELKNGRGRVGDIENELLEHVLERRCEVARTFLSRCTSAEPRRASSLATMEQLPTPQKATTNEPVLRAVPDCTCARLLLLCTAPLSERVNAVLLNPNVKCCVTMSKSTIFTSSCAKTARTGVRHSLCTRPTEHTASASPARHLLRWHDAPRAAYAMAVPANETKVPMDTLLRSTVLTCPQPQPAPSARDRRAHALTQPRE